MNDHLTPACHSLPEKTRIELTSLLQEWLADAIDLMLQARQACWKVKDHPFNALHVMFDKMATDAGKYVDLIAARIIQLGDSAQGALRVAAEKFGPLDIASGRKHVAEQSRAIAFYVELVRRTASFLEAHAHSKN